MRTLEEASPNEAELRTLTSDQFSRIEDTVENARNVETWDLVKELPALATWHSPKERKLASRIASRLGAPRLSTYLDLRNWRQNRDLEQYNASLIGYHYSQRGALDFIRNTRSTPIPQLWSAENKAIHNVYLAYAYSAFRDFPQTWKHYQAACSLAPENRWIAVCKGALLETEGKRDEAIEAFRSMVETNPSYSFAWDRLAYSLWRKREDDEALDILESIRDKFQCGSLALTEHLIHSDQDNHQKSLDCIDAYESFTPLLEKAGQRKCAAKRMDAYRGLRQFEKALEQRESVAKKSFHSQIADTLSSGQEGKKRNRLEVPHVIQDHMTCAPASIAMLCAYWKKDISHDSIVNEICYDGTYDASERKWCEENGWFVSECRLDWKTLKSLIDLAIPFAVSTKEIQSGHLQVATGYDELIDAIILQDPSSRHYVEHLQKPFFEKQRLYGPRALIIVPPEQKNTLESLELPDSELFTEIYKINDALDRDDRDRASQHLRRAQEISPENSITLFASQSVANYDGAQSQQLEVIEKLETQYPEDERLAWQKLGLLRSAGLLAEASALIKKFAKNPKSSICWTSEYAEELSNDARHWQEAESEFKKSIRCSQTESSTLQGYSELQTLLKNEKDALLLSRLAAYASYRKEYYNRKYADNLYIARKKDDAIEHLMKRVEEFGNKSPWPRITLCQFLDHCSLHLLRRESLDKLLQEHPKDGDALIFAAETYSSIGEFESSTKALKAAKNQCPFGKWTRAAAQLFENQLQTEKALELWTEIGNREPLAKDVSTNLPKLLDQMRSSQEALKWLQERHQQYPNSYRLKVELITRYKNDDRKEAIELLREMIDIYPDDAWSLRSLSDCLRLENNVEESLKYAKDAVNRFPNAPASWYYLGLALTENGDKTEAKNAHLHGIDRWPDYEFNYEPALENCHTREEKEECLARIKTAVEKASISGDACSNYYHLAKSFIPLDELLATLVGWSKVFTNCWYLESVLVKCYRELGKQSEALDKAKETAERFSHFPAALADYAELLQKCGANEDAIKNWKTGLDLNRSWTRTTHGLVNALDTAGRSDEAIEVLQTGLQANPKAYTYYGYLGDILLKRGELEKAANAFKKAIMIEPGYDWAWGKLSSYLNNTKRHSEIIDLSREITRTRPGEARSWLILGEQLNETTETFEALKAFEKALELNPNSERAVDFISVILSNMHRIDEAIELCSLPKWQKQADPMLKGRLAWLLFKSGKKDEAIEKLQTTLHDHPSYQWGWERMCDWYLDTNELSQARETALQYSKKFPTSADAMFQRAWVEYQDNRLKECALICKQVLALSPSHSTAAYNLLRSSVSIPDVSLIRDTKESVRSSLGEAIFLCFDLCEAILTTNIKKTEELVPRVSDHPSLPSGWFQLAQSAFDKSTRSGDWLYRRIEKAVKGKPHTHQLAKLRFNALCNAIHQSPGQAFDNMSPLKTIGVAAIAGVAIASRLGVPLFIGLAIYNSSRRRKRTKILPLLEELSKHPHAFNETLIELMDVCGTETFAHTPTRKAIKKYAAQITKNPDLLGKAGYACASIFDWESMIELYLSAERSKRWESWMTFNYTNALIYAGELDTAYDLVIWALETLVPDHTTDGLRVQAAWIQAIKGDMLKAKEHAEQISESYQNYGGTRLAHLALKRFIAIERGDCNASEALEGYLVTMDRSKMESMRVEISIHNLNLKKFSTFKLKLYPRFICSVGLQLRSPVWSWRKRKISQRLHLYQQRQRP